jgi:hypothetical protein
MNRRRAVLFPPLTGMKVRERFAHPSLACTVESFDTPRAALARAERGLRTTFIIRPSLVRADMRQLLVDSVRERGDDLALLFDPRTDDTSAVLSVVSQLPSQIIACDDGRDFTIELVPAPLAPGTPSAIMALLSSRLLALPHFVQRRFVELLFCRSSGDTLRAPDRSRVRTLLRALRGHGLASPKIVLRCGLVARCYDLISFGGVRPSALPAIENELSERAIRRAFALTLGASPRRAAMGSSPQAVARALAAILSKAADPVH